MLSNITGFRSTSDKREFKVHSPSFLPIKAHFLLFATMLIYPTLIAIDAVYQRLFVAFV